MILWYVLLFDIFIFPKFILAYGEKERIRLIFLIKL